jgi:uncharacterized membrane protein YbhN (UPF0104 family)
MSGRADAVAAGDPQPYGFDTKREAGADYRTDAGHDTHVPSLVLWRLFTWIIPPAVGAVSLGMRGARRAT